MSLSTLIITILAYIIVIFAFVLWFFVYISILFSDKITKWLASKIKEKRKGVINLGLQDLSLLIQLAVGIGIAVLLFALSKTGVQAASFMLMGLIGIATGIFLLFWRYLPLRTKMNSLYATRKE